MVRKNQIFKFYEYLYTYIHVLFLNFGNYFGDLVHEQENRRSRKREKVVKENLRKITEDMEGKYEEVAKKYLKENERERK